MSNANEQVWRALAAQFPREAVKTRPAGRAGNVSYITARTVMNRLDEVLGPENWTADYTPFGPTNSVHCRLTVLLPDGTKAAKCDVGAASNLDDDGENDKGAVSDALKRAAVQFGVGRYLYHDGVPACYGGGEAVAAPIEVQARPALEAPTRPAEPAERRQGAPPTTGKDLYRWAKDHDHLGFLSRLGKSWEYPPRMLDWSTEQVEAALHELHAKERAPANGRRWGG